MFQVNKDRFAVYDILKESGYHYSHESRCDCPNCDECCEVYYFQHGGFSDEFVANCSSCGRVYVDDRSVVRYGR